MRVRVHVQFDIYGSIDDEAYWNQCLRIIEKVPDNISIEYKGVSSHDDVLNILSRYDLFFLPTKGENFGHAIFESISAGTPVLISDQTPWCDFEDKGVGWSKNLKHIEDFVEIIEKMDSLDSADRNIQRKKVIKYAQKVAGNDDNLNKNRNLFLSLTSEKVN